jgi:hypothetical protein
LKSIFLVYANKFAHGYYLDYDRLEDVFQDQYNTLQEKHYYALGGRDEDELDLNVIFDYIKQDA